MNEINEEIKITINLIQSDICAGLRDEAKPLTADELMAGGWWCGDTSEDSLKAFILFGLKDGEYEPWDGSYYACFLYESGCKLIDRGYKDHPEGLKRIHRIGNDFYWCE